MPPPCWLIEAARERGGSIPLEPFADHMAQRAGVANGARVRRWFQDKKAGWYAVFEDPQMPVTSTLLDQAHNAIERKLFAMKGFHHPGGSQQAFLVGLAHLYNLVPYQRRAQHAGQCGVEVEDGRGPTQDWCLNLQILTTAVKLLWYASRHRPHPQEEHTLCLPPSTHRLSRISRP